MTVIHHQPGESEGSKEGGRLETETLNNAYFLFSASLLISPESYNSSRLFLPDIY